MHITPSKMLHGYMYEELNCPKYKKVLFGLQITFPDFHMYEQLDQHRVLDAKCLDKYPKLKAFMDRFEVIST